MTEEEWKEYTIRLSKGIQAMTQEQLQNQAYMNAIANVSLTAVGFASLANTFPPLVITDRVWNEDIW